MQLNIFVTVGATVTDSATCWRNGIISATFLELRLATNVFLLPSPTKLLLLQEPPKVVKIAPHGTLLLLLLLHTAHGFGYNQLFLGFFCLYFSLSEKQLL